MTGLNESDGFMALFLSACYFLPIVLSAALTGLILRWASRRGFVDSPAGHKAHERPVPLGGGVAIFVTLVLGAGSCPLIARLLLAAGPPAWVPEMFRIHLEGLLARGPALWGVLGGAAILHVVGLIDDRRALGAAPKLAAQVVAALLVVGLFRLRGLEMFGPTVAVVVSVLWIVVITNAFNFLDNMDGLCGGVAVIALLIFAVSARLTGQLFVPALSLLFAGAVSGFLLFNFPPARIFMGDAGSMVIGFMLSVLPILTTFHNPALSRAPFGVLVPVVVLAVPLYDFVSVVWIRYRSGASIFQADRRHFSHRLAARGLGRRATVLTIYLATAATAIPAMFLPNCSWPRAAVIVTQCLCVVALIALLERGNHGGGPTRPKN